MSKKNLVILVAAAVVLAAAAHFLGGASRPSAPKLGLAEPVPLPSSETVTV